MVIRCCRLSVWINFTLCFTSCVCVCVRCKQKKRKEWHLYSIFKLRESHIKYIVSSGVHSKSKCERVSESTLFEFEFESGNKSGTLHQYLYHMKRDYHTIVLMGNVAKKPPFSCSKRCSNCGNKSFSHDAGNAFAANGSRIHSFWASFRLANQTNLHSEQWKYLQIYSQQFSLQIGESPHERWKKFRAFHRPIALYLQWVIKKTFALGTYVFFFSR